MHNIGFFAFVGNTNLLCKREGVAYAKHLRKISPEV